MSDLHSFGGRKGSTRINADIIIEDEAEQYDDPIDGNKLDTEIQSFITK